MSQIKINTVLLVEMSSHDNATESTLMQAYQKGETKAFDQLYGIYAPRLMGYLRHHRLNQEEADDVFQLIFIKIHQSRNRYNPTYPVAAWFFCIARTSLIDFLRKKKGKEISLDEQANKISSPLENETHPEEINWNGLKPQERKAIEYRYMNEKSYEEIADLLKTSSSNARQLVSRGIAHIKQVMGKRKNL